MKIYLASRSPRRRQLLEQTGVDYEPVDADVDETWQPGELPRDYVQRLALEKARAGFALTAKGPVLGADTAVVLDNDILGKAESIEEAGSMLARLSGRTHEVLSAVAIVAHQTRVMTNVSRVAIRPLTAPEIEDYCNTGEPLGKAGGYAIQGRAAAFIARLEGSYSGVMGLPLFETHLLLEKLQRHP